MYVCLCNGLTDRQVTQAVAGGASLLREVYAACDCRAQCGRCSHLILDLLRGHLCCRERAKETAAVATP